VSVSRSYDRGRFCRRFSPLPTLSLQKAINHARQQVWRWQAPAFFGQATIEADGTRIETAGEKKTGIGINYQGRWGYHPLVVTLAETKEVVYLSNRPGNRPSRESSPLYFDLAIDRCRKAGFRKLVLRGDTDFALTVLRKALEESLGQQLLFPQQRDFFFITNAKRSELSARQVIAAAHQRCDQENVISQLKACHALAAPLESLASRRQRAAIRS
jgi:hypothetical protein